MMTITINRVRLTADQLRTETDSSVGAGSIVLLQWTRPLSPSEREIVERAVELLDVVPERAYIASVRDADSVARLEAQLPVRVLRYDRRFKLSPALAALSAEGQRSTEVSIVTHRDVDLAPLLSGIASLAGCRLERSDRGLRGSVPIAALSELASIDEVRHVEPAAELEESCSIASELVRADRAWSVGYRGEGEVIAVCDSGFDAGSSTCVHPAFLGRVLGVYQLGDFAPHDAKGHGTLVASCALGDGRSALMGDSVGVAPGAKLVAQSIQMQSDKLRFPGAVREVFETPLRDHGARIHNLSFNDASARNRAAYTELCRSLDAYLFQSRETVLCLSAGNYGRAVERADGTTEIEARSIAPPGSCKNAIVVGASESRRPEYPETYGAHFPNTIGLEPFASDRLADDPETVMAISGRGPTLDGRVKPDVVAPGSCILGAASRRGPREPDSTYGTSVDDLYRFGGGTSLASGFVAGACAVIRGWLRTERGISRPSAALVKAVLICGATPLRGRAVRSERDMTVPDTNQGFGRVDLAASLGLDGSTVELHDEGPLLRTGEQRTFCRVLSTPCNLVATVVWSDPPSETLVNDLDLIVTSGGEERHGNVPAGGTGFDRHNNVEQVRWPNVPPGSVEMVVRAHHLTLDQQSFALVWRVEPAIGASEQSTSRAD